MLEKLRCTEYSSYLLSNKSKKLTETNRISFIKSIRLIEEFDYISGKPFRSSTCFLFTENFVEENWSLFTFRSIARVRPQVERRDHKMQLSTAVCLSYAWIAFRCSSQVWARAHGSNDGQVTYDREEKLKVRFEKFDNSLFFFFVFKAELRCLMLMIGSRSYLNRRQLWFVLSNYLDSNIL